MLSFGKQGIQFNIETWGALLPQSFEHIMIDIWLLFSLDESKDFRKMSF